MRVPSSANDDPNADPNAHPADDEGDGEFRTVAMSAPVHSSSIPSPVSDRPEPDRPAAKAAPAPRPVTAPISRGRLALPLPSASRHPAPQPSAVPNMSDPTDDEVGAATQLIGTDPTTKAAAPAPTPQPLPKQPKGLPVKLSPEAFRATTKSAGVDKPAPESKGTSPSAGVNVPARSSPLATSKVSPPLQKPRTEPYAFPSAAKGTTGPSSSGSVKVVPSNAKQDDIPRLYDEDPGLDDGPTQLAAGLADAARAKTASRSDAETVAVDRAQFGVAQTEAPPRPSDPKKELATGRAAGEDEATRAVPRDDLVRAEPGLFGTVSDPPPFGEDSTLAVPAGVNPAARPNPGSPFAATQQHDDSHSFSASMTGPRPFVPPVQPMQGVQPVGSLAPQVPMAAPPPHWGGQPMQQQGMQPMQGHPMGMPMHGMPQGQMQQPMMMGPMSMPQPVPAGAAPSSPRVSNQMILLVAIGAVCLAIFGIGIYLFVTTKF